MTRSGAAKLALAALCALVLATRVPLGFERTRIRVVTAPAVATGSTLTVPLRDLSELADGPAAVVVRLRAGAAQTSFDMSLDGVPVVCSSAGVCPDPHDTDNQYTYSSGDPLGPPGTAFTVLLAQLNAAGGFAGHTDWRLPTMVELQSLVDYADPSSPATPVSFDTGCAASCPATARELPPA